MKTEKTTNKFGITKLFLVVSLTILLLILNGCKKELPKDLEAERVTLNSKIKDVSYKEETNYYKDNSDLLKHFEELKVENTKYIDLLVSRGFEGNVKKDVENYIDEKIAKYEGLIASEKSNYNSSSSQSSSTSYGSKTCSWCGKSFTGSHYTHLGKLAPCQSSTSSSSINTYCSMECCSNARRSSCPTCN